MLKEIGDLEFVSAIQLMTYDCNGASNCNPKTGKGITGFNSNIYPVPESDFSIDVAVTAMTAVSVPSTNVSIGIPAYCTSLATYRMPTGDCSNPWTETI